MDTFPQRIRELRTKKEINQEELGQVVGLGKQAVSSWERGESKPRADVLNTLADFFNVSTDYLLGRTDDPIPELDKDTNEKPRGITYENVNKTSWDTVREKVIAQFDQMDLTDEEKAAADKIKKMPINEQQKSFLKTIEKYKSLSMSDQEALAKIIDSLSSRK